MPRKAKTQAAEQPEPLAPAVEQVIEQAQERRPGEDDEPPRKKWTPPADPFGFENIRGEGNRARLLKSEGEGAWVIRFEKPPNEMPGFSKDSPHPVLKMLKDEGFRWGFDGGDGKGGHGKRFSGDPYGQDHIEARRVLRKAAEMIGAKVEQGQDIPI